MSYKNDVGLLAALRCARHELTTLHGLEVFDAASPTKTWKIDLTRLLKTVDDAIDQRLSLPTCMHKMQNMTEGGIPYGVISGVAHPPADNTYGDSSKKQLEREDKLVKALEEARHNLSSMHGRMFSATIAASVTMRKIDADLYTYNENSES